MMPMTLSEVAQAVGCTAEYFLNNHAKITSISTDSRPQPEDEDKESCLFVALRGEKFDGHQYVDSALRNKAAYALVDEKGVQEYCSEISPEHLIVCKDTEQGFLDLAGYYRNQFQFKMVGVTGSVGKTTTKEMIAQVLSAQYETLKTQGNFNNRVGLPKTLFQLDNSIEAAVIEMGMNSFGEISDLTRRARPDAAVITNIGVAHIEYLGSRAGILKAKMEIIEGMKEGSPLILNKDDDMLADLDCPQMKKIYYGIDRSDCDVHAKDIQEEGRHTSFTIVYEGKEVSGSYPDLWTPQCAQCTGCICSRRVFHAAGNNHQGSDRLQAFRYAPEGRTEKRNLCCGRLLQRRTGLDEGSNPHLWFHETSKR